METSRRLGRTRTPSGDPLRVRRLDSDFRDNSETLQRKSFLIFPSYFLLLTFPIVPGNKKAAEAFLRAAAFG
jgi:hypothetical protein